MPTLALVSELTSATKRNGILHPSPCAPVPSVLPAAAAPAVGAARIQERNAAINRHDSSESDIEGGARGRSSHLSGCGQNGHRSFGDSGPRGESKGTCPVGLHDHPRIDCGEAVDPHRLHIRAASGAGPQAMGCARPRRATATWTRSARQSSVGTSTRSEGFPAEKNGRSMFRPRPFVTVADSFR